MKVSATRDALGFLVLLALGVFGRLLPHAPNFTPMAAIALFGGYFLSRRSLAVAAPLLAMALSDAVIGTYDWRIMASVYLSLLVPIALRGLLSAKPSTLRIGAAALVSSLAFFVVTNFAVWYFGAWYSHNLAGMTLCYAAAMPFLKYTVAGDIFWSTLLFGLYRLATSQAIQELDWRRLAPFTSSVFAP